MSNLEANLDMNLDKALHQIFLLLERTINGLKKLKLKKAIIDVQTFGEKKMVRSP